MLNKTHSETSIMDKMKFKFTVIHYILRVAVDCKLAPLLVAHWMRYPDEATARRQLPRL